MAEFSFAGQRGEAARKIGLNIQKTTGTQQDYERSQQVIQEAKENFRQTFGKELSTNSEVRTREYQQQLYDRAQKGEPGIYIPADPSKTPSADYFHLYSMDISPSKLGTEERKWLRDNGWQLVHGSRDPVHWQYVGPVTDKNSPPATSIENRNTASGQIPTGRGTPLTPRQTGNLSQKPNPSDTGPQTEFELANAEPLDLDDTYGFSDGGDVSMLGLGKNRLEDYPNYSYGISLHYMDMKKYNDVIVENTQYSASDGRVLIASGGRRTADLARNPIFDRDMYIDELRVNCVIGHNSQSRGSNVIEISFTITEPLGMSLMDKILEVANQEGIQAWDQMPFVLQIDFFANSEDGQPINTVPNTTKRICIKIIEIKVQINVNGASYRVTAVPQSHVALTHVNSATPLNLEVKAQTIKDFFASEGSAGEVANAVGARGETNQADRQKSKKTYSYAAALNSYQEQLKKLQYQDTADVYKFEFDDEMSSSKIFVPERMPINRVPNQNDRNPNPNINREQGLIPIQAGSLIKEVINMVLTSSDYYRNQIKSSADDESVGGALSAGTGSESGAPLKTHKITTKVKYGDWDEKRKLYQKTMTFMVKKYEYSNTKFPEAAKSKPKTIHREYNYLYTGLNQQILDFAIDFNTMFYTVLTAFEKKYQSGTTLVGQEQDPNNNDGYNNQGAPGIQVNRIQNIISDTRVSSYQLGVLDKKTVEAHDLFNSIMTNSRGDMINVQLKIAGDPDLIKQDDLFGSTLNNSIPTDQQELYVKLLFKLPEDIDQSTGKYIANQQNIFSGVYRIMTVDNVFERGQFTQTLDLIRIFDDNQDRLQSRTSPRANREAAQPPTTQPPGLRLPGLTPSGNQSFRLPSVSKEEYDKRNPSDTLKPISTDELSPAGRAVLEQNSRPRIIGSEEGFVPRNSELARILQQTPKRRSPDDPFP